MRRLLIACAVLALPPMAASGISAIAADSSACEWLAGDLHIHTTYSHDSYGGPTDDNTGPDEAYTLGHSVTSQFGVAASRDLDYLAITDHNDVRSISDPGFGAFGVIPVRGYENSLHGHAQMLGAAKLYDNGDESAGAVQRIADELRVDGGVFQANHPADGSTNFPDDADWEYLYEVVPDTVEVWNISRLWQPPMPSGSSNDDAVRYWEGWLDRGHKVGATGGSDNHWLSTTAVQGAGQPTTWVCAASPNEAGILDGLRLGRTFISHQPPAYQGPRIFLEADSDGDGTFEAIVGDSVPPGSEVRVHVVGAPASLLTVATDGGVRAFDPVAVTSTDFEHRFTLPDDVTWVRAEIAEPDLVEERKAACDGMLGSDTTYCRNQLLVLGMTSALYFEEEVFDPTTTLTYDGDTTARVGGTATLAATLLDSVAAPLPGQTITLTFRNVTYQATTDSDGRAVATARATGPPGTYEVVSSYEGSETYSPSTDSDTVTVTAGPPR